MRLKNVALDVRTMGNVSYPLLPQNHQASPASTWIEVYMSIYNPGNRIGLIKALSEMRTYLDKDEQELKDLTDSAIAKLNTITNAEFDTLDLVPDFDS